MCSSPNLPVSAHHKVLVGSTCLYRMRPIIGQEPCGLRFQDTTGRYICILSGGLSAGLFVFVIIHNHLPAWEGCLPLAVGVSLPCQWALEVSPEEYGRAWPGLLPVLQQGGVEVAQSHL